MEWSDDSIILSARPHGENASIVTLFSANQGIYAGLVHGGQGRRMRGQLEPGTKVKATWKARLADHLGHFTLDVGDSFAGRWLTDPEVLALLSSICATTQACLPERQPLPGIYAGLSAWLDLEEPSLFAPIYVKFEIELLRALGYGLDLSVCAVSGREEGLTHVSPRTGRAVSAEEAKPYGHKLLVLPPFLCGASTWSDQDIQDGLTLTAHFLTRQVFANDQRDIPSQGAGALPFARRRLSDLYAQKTAA